MGLARATFYGGTRSILWCTYPDQEDDMIITTTPSVEGQPVTEYLGIVTGEAIMGADAILSVDLDYETVGANGSMLMVTASGTAARLGKPK